MRCAAIHQRLWTTMALGLLVASPGIAADTAAPTPSGTLSRTVYGAWGLDLAGADLATRPGDDFFRYANGAWLDRVKIPGDRPAWTLRLEMTDRTEARLHELLEQAAHGDAEPDSLEAKAGAFYASFMDQARVDGLGARPLSPELEAVRAAPTRDAMAALTGRANVSFQFPLFVPVIDVDLKDPNRYAVYLSQGGLGLPDRDYYLEPAFDGARKAYLGYVETLLRLLGWPDPAASAREVVAFETSIARVSWTKTQQRDLLAIYNPMTVDELARLAPGFAWRQFLDSAGLADVHRVIVAEQSAFPQIARAFAAAPLGTLRAWQAFHVADNAAPYLSEPFVRAHFELRYRTLSGQQEQRARWKRALAAVAGADASAGDSFGTFGTLGFGVGELYSARYFPPEAKAKIEALVANVRTAFRARLERLDWMGPETRREALRKLDTYTIKVGYPDHPRDYGRVEIRRDDLLGNVRRAAANDWAFYTGRLPGPVDRSDWLMTPQTNNAYNGSLRDIVFPAGILQAPMFDPGADPAVNYGAIGAVIGHELTHGFDDEGRKIDADGALRDWWTKADAEQFEARARRLGAQYDAFEPLPGVKVNGTLTMGENIADLGGLAVALDAYHASLQGAPAPVIDGLTGDQRVFLGWAQAWRGKVSDDFVRKQVVSDPHSPRQFRVLGPTRNIDAWYDAFGVRPGDRMFLPPAERVRIW